MRWGSLGSQALRYGLAGILAFSAISKVIDPVPWSSLPHTLAAGCEVFLVLLLLLPRRIPVGLQACCFGFLGAGLVNLGYLAIEGAHGESCGCFGSVIAVSHSASLVLQGAVVLSSLALLRAYEAT